MFSREDGPQFVAEVEEDRGAAPRRALRRFES